MGYAEHMSFEMDDYRPLRGHSGYKNDFWTQFVALADFLGYSRI